ncbi:hypothetical protein JA1_002396 [Spathaspora sp. JA1]|nr:hypothetical protein JA1_002396 [Spathaspora sp. JA1]
MTLFSFSKKESEVETQIPTPEKHTTQEESHGLIDTLHQASESMHTRMQDVHLFEGMDKSRKQDPMADDMDDFVNLLG